MDNRAHTSGRRSPLLGDLACPLLAAAVLFVAACSPASDADAQSEEVATAAADAALAMPGLASERPDPADLPENAQVVPLDNGTFMVPYEAEMPGFDVSYQMTPIPGGTFTMGSPPDEPGRQDDEGPQFEVEVDPFWMAPTAVTWEEYRAFLKPYEALSHVPQFHFRYGYGGELSEEQAADAVTIPTPIWHPPHTYEFGGDPEHPAVTVTPYAARQYTKFLSKLTGRFYRLPTEAEWEYAARAGTTTRWSFGDDGDQLSRYSHHYDPARKPEDVGLLHAGSLRPNPWGLHDVHGNVADIVIDQYVEDHYERFADAEQPVHWADVIAWPTEPWPIVVRGGGWDYDPADTRSAYRWQTDDPEWKPSDVDLPQSPYWYTDYPSMMVGFRIVRPLHEPDEATQHRFWGSGEADLPEQLWLDVTDRAWLGRGVFAPINKEHLHDYLQAWEEMQAGPQPIDVNTRSRGEHDFAEQWWEDRLQREAREQDDDR